jgi:8-oxo-dGTP pyrophosphatase MutT (NUDIX family)
VNESVLQAGCIVLRGKYAILRRTADGHWVFPKGHVESGELPSEAARREVAEETGLQVEVGGEVGTDTFTYQGETRQVIYYLALVVAELSTWREHSGIDAFAIPLAQVRQTLSFASSRVLWDRALELEKEQQR